MNAKTSVQLTLAAIHVSITLFPKLGEEEGRLLHQLTDFAVVEGLAVVAEKLAAGVQLHHGQHVGERILGGAQVRLSHTVHSGVCFPVLLGGGLGCLHKVRLGALALRVLRVVEHDQSHVLIGQVILKRLLVQGHHLARSYKLVIFDSPRVRTWYSHV